MNLNILVSLVNGFIVLLFAGNANESTVVTRKYSIYYDAKKIGNLTATKTTVGKNTTYKLDSDVDINLVVNYKIIEKINEEFKDDKLHNSSHTRHINSELKAENKIVRNGTAYEMSSGGKKGGTIKEWIKTTALTIYFKEPTDSLMVYSQNHQQLVNMKKTETGKYTLHLPHNKKAYYQYSGGQLKILESETNFGKVKFVLD